MSVPYLREAAAAGENDKLIRFVRLHLGDGKEDVGRKEIDKSWAEAIKILLRYEPVDESAIASVLSADESTLALLYFHLHFYLIQKSGEWIHFGSRLRYSRIRAKQECNCVQDCGTRSTSDTPVRLSSVRRFPGPPRSVVD